MVLNVKWLDNILLFSVKTPQSSDASNQGRYDEKNALSEISAFDACMLVSLQF